MITINARGARTLADVRPLTVEGQYVYVTVDANVAQLHIAGRIVAERPAFQIDSIIAAQNWAYTVIDMHEIETNETVVAVETVVETAAVYEDAAAHEDAAAQVRENAATALAEAGRLDARATVVASRSSKANTKNPRHPQNQAARIRYAAQALRKDAVILAAWTAEDEAGYTAYISDGLGATDGWYVPEGRANWKRHEAR